MRGPLKTLLLALALAAAASAATAQTPSAPRGAQGSQGSASDPAFSRGGRFDQRSGSALYAAICAGCHMPGGKGAQGAGAYPALAGNPRLESGAYVATMVLKGRRAMPSFAAQLDDDQVAAVVQYARQQIGHASGPSPTAAEVHALR